MKYCIMVGDFFQCERSLPMKNLVEIRNNQVVVSSRQVAEKFGKEHRHVLDSIREIVKAENSALTYFHESSYQAGTGKQYPEYLMNRDGFTLLAMGFTGKDALQWKMKYIAAFNEMEKQLNDKPANQPTAIQQQRAEAMLLNARSRQSKLWLAIAEKTDIKEYKHICQQKAAEALAGTPLLPMEEAGEKTYSATEVGEKLGISAKKVGQIAKLNNLKTPENGKYFYDKSPHSCKEVETFRYNEKGLSAISKCLAAELVVKAVAENSHDEFMEKYGK